MTAPPPPPPPLLRDPNLHVVFSVTLMAILGVASVTPAFPAIAETLAVTPQAVGLLISAFTLPGVFLTPLLGVLADRLGRKRVLVPSLFVFAVAGTACGFAREFELLVTLRLLQGVGAAALGALNVTIIGDLYGGGRRTTAMGYNASVLSFGTGLYPMIGGALATLGWYAPFFLPGLAVPVALLVLYRLENPEPQVVRTLRDYLASTLRSLRSRQALTMFAASVVTFILIYGSYLAYFPFVLSRSVSASPFWIGVTLSAASVATGVTSFHLGRLAARFGERRLIQTGFACYAAAMLGVPLADPPWVLALPIMLFGVGNGINIPSILTVLTRLAPAEYRAAFMSVNGMLLRLGQTLGPLVIGGAFALGGLDGAFLVSAGIAGAMLVVLLLVGWGANGGRPAAAT